MQPLSPDDALSLEIGRVARAHVGLDFELVQLYNALIGPSLGSFLANDFMTGSLIEHCRKMWIKTGFAEQVIEAGRASLEAARAANNRRNRVVHDMWLPQTDSQGAPMADSWAAYQRKRGELGASSGPPQPLGELHGLIGELARARYRVSAMGWYTRDHLQPWGPPFEVDKGGGWLEIMAGEFDVLPDGGARPRSWRERGESEDPSGAAPEQT
jgi:hypothetical protein